MSGPARGTARTFPWLSVTGFFAVVSVWMTRPLAWRAAGAFAETCDTYEVAWILGWDVHALLTRPKRLFDANIFHPLKDTLALAEHMLGNVPTFAPVVLATGNPVLGVNVVILASFVLSGATMTRLVYGWTGRIGPSLVAGFVFAFVPYRIAQLAHVQLLSLQWLPLAVYCGERVLRGGGGRAWIGLAGFTLWQCLVSYYVAYLTALVLGVYALAFVWTRRRVVRARHVGAFVGALALVVVVMAPLTAPYVRLGSTGVIQRFTTLAVFEKDPNAMALADPIWSYLTIPANSHGVYRDVLTTRSPVLDWEKALFQGFLPLVVIGLGFGLARRRSAPGRDAVAPLLAVLVFAYVVSLGPFLVWNQTQTAVRLPAYWLATTVPGLASVRAWPRFGFGVTFALAGLAGIALARMTADASRRTRALVTAALLVGLTLEYDVAPLDLTTVPPVATPAHAWLAQHAARREALFILPTGAPACVQARYMYHTMAHWLPLGTGYSGHFPSAAEASFRIGAGLPERWAIRRARRRHFRWVVTERTAVSAAQRDAFEAAAAAGRIVRAATFEDEAIYDLGTEPLPTATDRGRS